MALAHPEGVPLLVIRSVSGPLACGRWPRVDRSSSCSSCSLVRGSTTLVRCTPPGWLYTGLLDSQIQDELQERVHDADETDDLLRLGLHRLPRLAVPFCGARRCSRRLRRYG
jgi:hypothetical protein